MRNGIVIGLLAVAVSACSGEIYLRDGVTDGDTFYLAERATSDPDPVLQSWVAYSLTISTCQLKTGAENPARATSFECELTARRILVDTWREKRATDASLSDAYLDDLLRVSDAGFLESYVASHFAKRRWHIPQTVDEDAYRGWAKQELDDHKPQTRLIGSWNYARNVNPL